MASLCSLCGLWLSSQAGLCPHHHHIYGKDWSNTNRIMCDFFHRKLISTRVPESIDDAPISYQPANRRDEPGWRWGMERKHPDGSYIVYCGHGTNIECNNVDYGTCPCCFMRTRVGCGHGPMCDECLDSCEMEGWR